MPAFQSLLYFTKSKIGRGLAEIPFQKNYLTPANPEGNRERNMLFFNNKASRFT